MFVKWLAAAIMQFSLQISNVHASDVENNPGNEYYIQRNLYAEEEDLRSKARQVRKSTITVSRELLSLYTMRGYSHQSVNP
jgi:hypothetical protein